jgi:hypothetical protein
MKEINAAFNSRDVDRIMAFFADDCTFLMGARARGGRSAPARQGRRPPCPCGSLPGDPRHAVDHVDDFICGNRAVSVWMVTGKGKDGERLNYRGWDISEVRDDKILNKDIYWKLVEQRDRL